MLAGPRADPEAFFSSMERVEAAVRFFTKYRSALLHRLTTDCRHSTPRISPVSLLPAHIPLTVPKQIARLEMCFFLMLTVGSWGLSSTMLHLHVRLSSPTIDVSQQPA